MYFTTQATFSETVISSGSYLPSEGLDADDHRVKVLFLPQVNGLEGLLGGHAACLGSVHKVVDVFHALEGHAGGLDLLDMAGLQGVDDPVKNQSDDGRCDGGLTK